MNRKALFDLSYGVYAVTSLDGKKPCGCIANSIMQVTSSPATIAVSINHDNYTNKCIKDSRVFAVSILPEDIKPSVIGTFGFKSCRDTDKFGCTETVLKNGLSVIAGAKSYIVCKIKDIFETETHTVFLGEVEDADVLSDKEAMTYSYYHRVIKGKAPKNAPTYVDEKEEQKKEEPKKEEPKKVYRCSICGYVYDGDVPFEELPDDYVCPVCGVPKSLFVCE